MIDAENFESQSFAASSNYELRAVKLLLNKVQDSTPGNITVSIRAATGGTGAHEPTGSDLASCVQSMNSLSEFSEGETIEFKMNTPVSLIGGVTYCIVVKGTDPAPALSINWFKDAGNNYTGGNRAVSTDDVTWTSDSTNDHVFEVYGLDMEAFDDNEILRIENFDRPSYGEVINQVIVNWWDKFAHKPRLAQAHDLALIEKQGNNVIEASYQHYGICYKGLANDVAERELRLTTSMLASMTIVANRKMSHLKPNSVFKLGWSDLGITEMYVRVIDINYGNLEKTEIIMSCIEDVFAPTPAIYADSQDTEWSAPTAEAVDVTVYELIETPYWILINELDNQADADARLTADNDASRMMIVAHPPSGYSYDYEYLIQHATDLGFNSEGTGAWTPNGTITEDIYLGGGNLTVTLDEDEYGVWSFVKAGSYAILNSEIIQIVSLDEDNSQMVIARGLFDTVPSAHADGDRIWFVGAGFVEVETDYTTGDQPQVKFLPRTGEGSLEEDDASTYTAPAMDSRAYRPYCPGNLKFNGESYPTFLSTHLHSNNWALTWAHRDRTHATQAGSQVLHTDTTDYGPEATASYTLKIYDEDNNLIRTATGLTGTSYDYPHATEISDAGSLQKTLRFVLYGVRDGYDSWQTYDVTIKRSLVGSVEGVSNVPSTDLYGCHLKLAGTCDATSGLSAHGLSYVPLRGASAATSGVTGSLDSQPELIGAAAATSAASGVISVDTPMEGTAAATGGTAGAMTIVGAGAILRDHWNDGDSAAITSQATPYDSRGEGQSFTASSSYTLESIKLKLSTDTDATGVTLTINVYATDGSGLPAGSILATGTIDGASIGIGDGNVAWLEAAMSGSLAVISSSKYAICVYSDDAANKVKYYIEAADNYAGGNRLYDNTPPGLPWGNISVHDNSFETWGT